MPWLILALGILVLGKATMGTESLEKDPFFEWDNLIRKYADQYGVPFEWMKAICLNESNLGRAGSVAHGLIEPQDVEGSKSSDGKSWGLFQLTLPTARQFEPLITAVGLNDPEISTRIAAKYLAYLIRLKGLDAEKVSRSYNGGPGYLNTVKGRNDTPAYYERFKRNLELIRSKQSS